MDIMLFGQQSSLVTSLTGSLRRYWPGARLVVVDPAHEWTDALAFAKPVASIIDNRDSNGDPADFVRRVRARCPGPVLLVGGPGTSEALDPLIHSGADDFLEEPFQPMEAFARVRMLVRRSSQKGAAERGNGESAASKVGSAVL